MSFMSSATSLTRFLLVSPQKSGLTVLPNMEKIHQIQERQELTEKPEGEVSQVSMYGCPWPCIFSII